MKRLVCFIKGHIYPEWPDQPCDLCGHWYEYGEAHGILGGIHFRWQYSFLPWLQRKREWLKCPDCGKRFGQHDDTVGHCPF